MGMAAEPLGTNPEPTKIDTRPKPRWGFLLWGEIVFWGSYWVADIVGQRIVSLAFAAAAVIFFVIASIKIGRAGQQ